MAIYENRGTNRRKSSIVRHGPRVRSMYERVRVSTRIQSPSLINSGTATLPPVETLAGLVTLVAVSPRTPGSVSGNLNHYMRRQRNAHGIAAIRRDRDVQTINQKISSSPTISWWTDTCSPEVGFMKQ